MGAVQKGECLIEEKENNGRRKGDGGKKKGTKKKNPADCSVVFSGKDVLHEGALRVGERVDAGVEEIVDDDGCEPRAFDTDQ